MADEDRSADVYEAALRSVSFEQKLRVSEDLRALAWLLQANAVRREHPEWSDDQVEQQVREVFLRVST
jgi:hypothetical protein